MCETALSFCDTDLVVINRFLACNRQKTNQAMMLSLHLCVPALWMGGPLLPARPSTLRVPAPTAAEIWVEPSNINLLTESLEQQVASSRGSTPPMILWAPMPQSQAGSEAPAPPPHGANTGVASWYAHTHV